jgi:excisionase family DNA binding protein
MSNGELLSSGDVARLLGCSPRTVHRLVKAGDLQPVHKLDGPNGAFLFHADAVEELARQRGVVAA